MNKKTVTPTPAPFDTGAGVNGLCKDLADRLPGLIDDAFQRYLAFAGSEPPTQPRGFTAYSNACRAAMAHLEQLLKLARVLSSGSPESPAPQDDIESLIARAKTVLDKVVNDT